MYLAASLLVAVSICRGVAGYENSSPLLLYSTSRLDLPQLQDLSLASTVQPVLEDALSTCSTNNYLLVQQPGVSSEDYICRKNTPFLRDHTSFMVRDVINGIDIDHVTRYIASTCNKQVKILSSDVISELASSELQNKVFTLRLPTIDSALSNDDKKSILQHRDNYISSIVANYFHDADYTLVYLTQSMHSSSLNEAHDYDAEIPMADFMHGGELVRRNVVGRKSGSSSNQTVVDGPLFDKYQFFGPGIFMGLFVGLILLAILYTGISALSSLQVTYGAFDKEQGQLAAKKQQ